MFFKDCDLEDAFPKIFLCCYKIGHIELPSIAEVIKNKNFQLSWNFKNFLKFNHQQKYLSNKNTDSALFSGPMSLPLITTMDHSGVYPPQGNMSASICVGEPQHQVNDPEQ